MNQDSREKTELSGTRITKQILKTRSGEFDLESIHSLILREMDIDHLGCIGDCTYLERLDLSRNDLANLRPLTPLKQLSCLNISANRITNIDPLKELVNLQTLNVSGNLISSVDSLQCLADLDSLSSLTLSDPLTGLNNPVCHSASYKSNVMSMLPRLKVMDGERMLGNGRELIELCQKLDAMLEGSQESTTTRMDQPSPWVSKDFWEIKGAVDSDQDRWSAEQQFQDILKSCKDLEFDASRSLTESAGEKT
ncbi:leucine-rich repeat-containing protein 61-like [Acanthaster planci]|uniref:Leucine-rich repeat-containing protein 61-like n=1 Tax=Acanthaster planci TaxID=133434 RepID=A0A8B7ZB83_ACAPL|nr:leucine-rich repeat-containing protein 61-like [Acanthaster planci]